MNKYEFVTQIRKSIIADGLSDYREIFESDPSEAKAPYWIRALSMHGELNEEERKILLEIIRQVMVDTISSVFSILDGVSYFAGQKEDFKLTIGDSREPLNGDLQELFFIIEEDGEDCLSR